MVGNVVILTTQLSLLSLCNLLLVVAGLVSVSRSKKIRRCRWLRAVLWSYLSFIFLMLIDSSLYSDTSYMFYLMQFPVVQCLAFSTCEYSFAVAENAGIKRPRFFRPVTGILSLIYMVGLWRAHTIGGDIMGPHYTMILALPIGLILYNTGYLAWAVAKSADMPVTRLVAACRHVAKSGSSNQAVLGVFATLLLCVVGALILLLHRDITTQKEFFLSSFYIVNTAIIVSFVVTYLNYVEERLDIGIKIVGTLQLILLSSAALLFMWLMEDERGLLAHHERMLESQSLVLTPKGDNLYKAEFSLPSWDVSEAVLLQTSSNKPTIMTLPFSFTLYGKAYSRLLLHPLGFVVPIASGQDDIDSSFLPAEGCFGDFPVLSAFCSNAHEFDVFLASGKEKVVVTWEDKAADSLILKGGLSQLVIKSSGVITLNYRDFPKLSSTLWSNELGISNGLGAEGPPMSLEDLPGVFAKDEIRFDLAFEKRKDMHGDLWPLMAILTLFSLLLTTVFPKYLKRVLSEPLAGIREGLVEVDQGNLEVLLDENAKDEFGDLTRGFNKMIRSLDEARQERDEQTDLLEKELSERTIEVAKRGDRTILSKDAIFEQKIRAAVEENMANFDFQVADLAIELAVSPRQLHRRVVTLTAQTPAALIRTLRLNHAKELLEAQAVNVSEAAYKTGFRDVGYFSRLFTKQFDVSPSELINRKSEA